MEVDADEQRDVIKGEASLVQEAYQKFIADMETMVIEADFAGLSKLSSKDVAHQLWFRTCLFVMLCEDETADYEQLHIQPWCYGCADSTLPGLEQHKQH